MLPQSTRQPVRRATLGLERCHIRGGWHAVQWHIHQHRVTTGGGYERISLGPVWKLSTAGRPGPLHFSLLRRTEVVLVGVRW